MNHLNLEYLESLYHQFQSSPQSVELEWRRFFEGVEFMKDGNFGLSEKELEVYNLIQSYRQHGHFEAQTNPLSLQTGAQSKGSSRLDLKNFNLTEKDLTQKFQIGQIIGLKEATLQDIINHLQKTYCGTLAIQFNDVKPEAKTWLLEKFEKQSSQLNLTKDQKINALSSLSHAEALEKFIHTRYVGTKRFSVEGGDATLPMLDHLVEKGSSLKVEEIVIGMAHRGRVNVLANFMKKDIASLFSDFNGPTELEAPIEDYDGDVKYHLGYSKTKKTAHGTVDCHLAFNPSHLEAVNPVVLGMARASQRRRRTEAQVTTETRKKVVPVLIHGDAAFAGQGIVLETLQMSQIQGYNVGGTLHLVIDNQVGFTTQPKNSRSTEYSADVAKMISIPVLHCNGDDVEACIKAMDIALEFRQTFGLDVVVTICCYRRFGHNEGDEPAYTQPLMYDIIKKHPTVRELYAKQLVSQNVLDQNQAELFFTSQMSELQKIYDIAKANPSKQKLFKFEGLWQGLKKATSVDIEKKVNTSVSLETLKQVGQIISDIPQSFNLHPKLTKLIEMRKKQAQGEETLDWGMGELLAYGTLLAEGTSVRLTGQDCVRGTFTHRHAGFYDTKSNEQYMPLKSLNADKVEFSIYDSLLSEYAVMGFEYGHSISDPSYLTMWEAQFGDFANGAQIMIDQFIAAAESKWQQMSGLVLLLPHGYEGQGPEHSSARLERFLQLCAQNNMTVTNLTTPAQIFHALRRQVKRDFRKPLVVMSPKSLLRHPRATSTLQDLAQGSFQEVIDESILQNKNQIEKIVFVSGKLYYELLEQREKLNDQKTALIRLEQIFPFPHWILKDIIKQYPQVKKIVWAQEEPQNMGAFQHVYFKFASLLNDMNSKAQFGYVGRPERSSPATGSVYRHKVEQQEIIEKIFKV